MTEKLFIHKEDMWVVVTIDFRVYGPFKNVTVATMFGNDLPSLAIVAQIEHPADAPFRD